MNALDKMFILPQIYRSFDISHREYVHLYIDGWHWGVTSMYYRKDKQTASPTFVEDDHLLLIDVLLLVVAPPSSFPSAFACFS